MQLTKVQSHIDDLWNRRDTLNARTGGEDRHVVENVLAALDQGQLRVAEKSGQGWTIHEWLKKAVLLSFRLNDSQPVAQACGGVDGFDKVPLKFAGWEKSHFDRAGFRAVPGAIVRRSAYIAPGVVLMPSFVNVGAYVDTGTMVDTWATVGSCAQIGKNVHISGGPGLAACWSHSRPRQ
ncbi:2,3,4,5-tetrahydropyridine-2,6-carboxylate N-succinyltransferase [Acetobacteraceae bacterium EV16G]